MKNQVLNLWFLLLFLLSCSGPQIVRTPSSINGALDYPLIFKTSRDILIPGEKATKKIPESLVIEELQNRPELLQKTRVELIKELESQSSQPIDLTKHTRLIPPLGTPGYSNMKLFVNHPYYKNRRLVPPHDLIKEWENFILSAQKEIILNVFDFDLEIIAEALIKQAKKGLFVKVGIDKISVIDVKPEVKLLEQRLLSNNVKVTGVNPVGLNHQKMTAIDWSIPAKASVLMSSGNLTKSCLEPLGDLKGTVPLPKESVPNANHFITMKSWLLANLVQHELTKTLDPNFLLRGQGYPLNGSYQVTGPGVDPETLEAYPEPSLIISFTPGGGMKSINKNLISHFLRKETGRIRMLQFAYSSAAVDEALLFRAEQDYRNKGNFNFLSVGDTPFAMMEWSRFLSMSGLKKVVDVDKKRSYPADPNSPWVRSLGHTIMKDVQKKVFIAPKIYGNNWVKVNGKNTKVSAKIRHKIIATERFAIMGTSFNFSEGAESNNEQILVFRDKGLADSVDGMVRYMVELSPGTVLEEGIRRTLSSEKDDILTDPEDIAGIVRPVSPPK